MLQCACGKVLSFEVICELKHGKLISSLAINNVFWTPVLDGCSLVHNTEKTLQDAAEWEASDGIGPDPNDGYFDTLPHTVGKLIKKR